MSAVRDSINCTIISVEIDLSNLPAKVPPKNISIPNYVADQLFFNVSNNGQRLSINISDERHLDASFVAFGANGIDVSFKYDGQEYAKESFEVEYVAGTTLFLRMYLDATLKEASLVITDAVDQAAEGSGNALVGFVLVGTLSGGNRPYRLEWLQSPVIADGGDSRTNASIVPRTRVPGSAMGPMGLATP